MAELLGVHPDTVSHYTRRGMPVLRLGVGKDPSIYDAVTCLAWSREQRPGTLDAEKIRTLKAQADLADLRIGERKGDLIRASEAERVWTSAVLDTQAAALELPVAVAPDCVAAMLPSLTLCPACRTTATGGPGVLAATREVRRVLEAGVRTMLRALARWAPKAPVASALAEGESAA